MTLRRYYRNHLESGNFWGRFNPLAATRDRTNLNWSTRRSKT
ncbi:MAG: hypothetical protein ACR9NN_00435 [Nostochopsis sp.]